MIRHTILCGKCAEGFLVEPQGKSPKAQDIPTKCVHLKHKVFNVNPKSSKMTSVKVCVLLLAVGLSVLAPWTSALDLESLGYSELDIV